MRGLLLVLLATVASAQRAPIFKTDGVSPRQGGAAELLEALCPGQVEVGDVIRCREFPDHTSYFDCPPTAIMVTSGHFLSPKGEDALLAISACEPPSANNGSTSLFTRQGGVWRRLWSKPGLITNRCHRMPLRSGRQILVCEMSGGSQGVMDWELYVVDVLNEVEVPRDYYHDGAIFRAVADIPCGGPKDVVGEPITNAYIERVEFRPRPSRDGENMTVFAQYGKTARTSEMIAACSGPPTKPYRIDFLFDGRTYKVAAHSVRASQTFGHR